MTLGPDRQTRNRWTHRSGFVAAPRSNAKANDDGADDDGTGKTADDGKGKDDKDGATGDKGKPDDADALIVVKDGKQYLLQEHANRLIGVARQEGRTVGKTEAEKAAQAAEDKAKGDYKAVADAAEAKVVELEAEIARQRLGALKSRIGAKHHLPQRLIDRLSGDDEKAIEEDAKAFVAELKIDPNQGERKAPDTDAGKGGKSGSKREDDAAATEKKRKGYKFIKPGDVAWG